MNLALFLLSGGAFGAYIFYERVMVPTAANKARQDLSKIKLSNHREIANLQQQLEYTKDRIKQVLEMVEMIDSDLLQSSSIGQISEIDNYLESIGKDVQLVRSTLSKRAQSGVGGNFKNFFTQGGNKQSAIAIAAESAGFYGNNNINNFLTVVMQKFPDIKNRDMFLALSDERREVIVRKVKTNNLPGNQ
jgi:hypothetical protein